jgi:glyoxylase-like metal-dependent hydrolase (beta-lactamase superfamily II)
VTSAAAPPAPTAQPAPEAPPLPPAPAASSPAPPSPSLPLRVRFLGVGGFLVEHGDEAFLTAPLYTRPSMVDASTGIPVESDAALVAARLPPAALANVHAILAGHAHYDHLLDVPSVMALAPQATLYSNLSARNLLAAFAPDRAAKCAGKPAQPASRVIARSRVVAVDDPGASTVD